MEEQIWTLKDQVIASCFITPEKQVPVLRLIFVNGDAEIYYEINLSSKTPLQV